MELLVSAKEQNLRTIVEMLIDISKQLNVLLVVVLIKPVKTDQSERNRTVANFQPFLLMHFQIEVIKRTQNVAECHFPSGILLLTKNNNRRK